MLMLLQLPLLRALPAEPCNSPSEIERRISSNMADYSKAFSLITLVDTLSYVTYVDLPKHIMHNAFVMAPSAASRLVGNRASLRLAILRIAAAHGKRQQQLLYLSPAKSSRCLSITRLPRARATRVHRQVRRDNTLFLFYFITFATGPWMLLADAMPPLQPT